jgi:hypothetical protein
VNDAVQKSEHDGFWIRYTNVFLDTALSHGVPQRKLALFRVGKGLYERIEEDRWSGLDMEVHEHPIISGSIGEIREPVVHNDERGLAKFIDRHRDYALWEARRFELLKHGGDTARSALTSRQRFKYSNIGKWWYPWFYFVLSYVARGGFLDGAAGFHYAVYKAWYFLTVRLLILERAHGREKTAGASTERGGS